MPSSKRTSPPAPDALPRRLRMIRDLRTARTLRACRADPAALRDRLTLTPGGPTLAATMRPFQRADFAALDPAWVRLAGRVPTGATAVTGDGESLRTTPVRRAWVERPRGHAKTADAAAMLAWALRFAARPVRGVIAAADREQGGLVTDALARLIAANRRLLGPVRVTGAGAANPANGARVTVLSSDVGSSYGLTPDFVICAQQLP